MTTSAAFQTITALLDNPESGLTEEEMRTLYAKVGEHTLRFDEAAVIAAARELAKAFEALGVTGAVAVEVGTSEWDNGYFFAADTIDLIGADENVIECDDEPDNDLFDAVEHALTQCVDSSLGRLSRATINLADGTLHVNA